MKNNRRDFIRLMAGGAPQNTKRLDGMDRIPQDETLGCSDSKPILLNLVNPVYCPVSMLSYFDLECPQFGT